MTPELQLVLELNAQLGRPVDIGATPYGFRRVIEIVSGTFTGPLLKGTLQPGGADWQIIRTDRVTELHAHYILCTDDGVLIQVKVRGLRHAIGDALERIAAGHSVDPSEYYFRVAPIFETPAGPYEWLNRSVFIGSGERSADGVRIVVYRVT
jgi:hypothetical protein